jgi:hypothetical protein
MVSEVFAGITSFKAMLDMAKALKDIDDATRRNAAVIDLQEKILSAQEAQSALIERIQDLEKEVADLKEWDGEKEKYELVAIAGTSFAYMPKPGAGNAEPPHWLCTKCFEDRKKSILQLKGSMSRFDVYHCASCGMNTSVPSRMRPVTCRAS